MTVRSVGQGVADYFLEKGQGGSTWRETVVASEARGTFTFAVVFVTGGIILTLECRKETVETILSNPFAEIQTMEDNHQVYRHKV
jgi:hypothetical protein